MVSADGESMATTERVATLRGKFHASMEAIKVVDDRVKNRKALLLGQGVCDADGDKRRRRRSRSKITEQNAHSKPRRAKSDPSLVEENPIYQSKASVNSLLNTQQSSQRSMSKKQSKGIPSRSKSDGRNIEKAAMEKRMPRRSKTSRNSHKVSVSPVTFSDEKGNRSFRNRRASMDSLQGLSDKKEKSTRQGKRSSLTMTRAGVVSQRKSRSTSIERAPERRINRGLSRRNSGVFGNAEATERVERSLSKDSTPEKLLRRSLSRKNSGLLGNDNATKRTERSLSMGRGPGQRLRRGLSRKNSGLVNNEDVRQRPGRSLSPEKVAAGRLRKSLSRRNSLADIASQKLRSRVSSRNPKKALRKSLSSNKCGRGLQHSNDDESIMTWQRSKQKSSNDRLQSASDHVTSSTKGLYRSSSALNASQSKILVDSVGLQAHRQRRRNSAFGTSSRDVLDSNAIRQSLALASADKNRGKSEKMLVDFPVSVPETLKVESCTPAASKSGTMTVLKKSSNGSLAKPIFKPGGEGSNHQRNESFCKLQPEMKGNESLDKGSLHLSSIHRNSSRGSLRRQGSSSRGSLSSFISKTSSKDLTGWDSGSEDEFAG